MENLKTTVAEKLQNKYPDKTPDDILEAISRSEEYFLSITKRRQVPEKALWLWVDLSAAMLTGTVSFIGSDAVVSSVKRGDTTVSYDPDAANLPVNRLLQQVSGYKVVITR